MAEIIILKIFLIRIYFAIIKMSEMTNNAPPRVEVVSKSNKALTVAVLPSSTKIQLV